MSDYAFDNYVPDEPSGYGEENNPFDPSNPYGVYSNWGGDTLSAMGVADDTHPTSGLNRLLSNLRNAFGKAADFATTDRGLMALLAALANRANRRGPSGGGATQAYAGYRPVARYAANGGLMHAYATGGQVRPFPMQDGGFVMTKRAVDGAGGHDGMRQIMPNAQPIRGPGTGTSDSVPAYIQGPHGRTPAKLSNGEAYIPPGHDSEDLYALMRSLEKRA